MPPDPPRGSGLRPSVLQGTCLLTSQCPSTSKVNENPGNYSSLKVGSFFCFNHAFVIRFYVQFRGFHRTTRTPVPLDPPQEYTHHSSCHPPGFKRGFIKGEKITLLRTNSSEKDFQEAMCNFKTRLEARGCPKNLIESTLTEISFAGLQSAPKKKT